MENRLIKVAKRLASLWKASRQLRVGLLLFLGVLLVAILAGVLSPYAPYYLSDDLLMPPGSENHPLRTDHMGHDVLSMILHRKPHQPDHRHRVRADFRPDRHHAGRLRRLFRGCAG